MSAAQGSTPLPEVWLRGPVAGVPAMLQPAAHALLQGQEELHRAAHALPATALWLRPGGVAPVGFHVRHAAGVIDRLLTYARGEGLSDAQRAALAAEQEPVGDAASLLAGLDLAVARAVDAYRATDPATLGDARAVGRAGLPSTVMGLLFHIAEHVQRHAGQAGTTARIVDALFPDAQPVETPFDMMWAMETVRNAYGIERLGHGAQWLAHIVTPDAELVQPALLPWGGTYRGPDGAWQLHRAVDAHIDAAFAHERLLPSGDRVVALGRLRGTARSTGAAFDVPAVHVWALRGDLVSRHEAYLDVPALLGALRR